MSEELRPCPFCGGEGVAYRVLDYPEKIGPRHSVICNGCGASVTTIFQSKWDAIEAWNRRAERTCHLIHEVEEEDDEFFDTVERHYYVCSECGSANRMDARYCDWCGARVIEEES